jgi:hypothetical protein
MESILLREIINKANTLGTEILPSTWLIKDHQFALKDLGIDSASVGVLLNKFNTVLLNSLISHGHIFGFTHGLFPYVKYISIKKNNNDFWKDDPLVIRDVKNAIGNQSLDVETILVSLMKKSIEGLLYDNTPISAMEAYLARMAEKGILKMEMGENKRYYYSVA